MTDDQPPPPDPRDGPFWRDQVFWCLALAALAVIGWVIFGVIEMSRLWRWEHGG